MSNKQRRDGDRRPSDRDRREAQPDEEQQRRPGDPDLQESDSLTALKAILGKVATLLNTLKLTQDECISLVEQLYGSVLDMDLKLAGETDDKRKSSVLAHIQNTQVTKSGGKLVVEFPKMDTPKPAPADKPKATPKAQETPAPASAGAPASEPEAPVEEAPAEPQPAPEPATEAPAVETPAAPEAQDKLDL